jgi:hypothetical protein
MAIKSAEPVVIPTESLAATQGGLSRGLALRARDIASERRIDAMNAGNDRWLKFDRQMNLFDAYKR